MTEEGGGHMDPRHIIRQSIDYIEDNIASELDYQQIAAKAYSSSYHFQRTFSVLTGYTLGEYIRYRRLACSGNSP